MPAVSTSTRQTQPAQGCLFWLGATRGWHYIKPCGAWQVLAGGNRDADSATRGWAPPASLWAPHTQPGPPGWPAAHRTTLLLMLVPRGVGMRTEYCACPTVPPSLCPGVHPALLCLVSTIAGPCISCLPMGRLRWVGSGLGTLGLCPHPVSPSCPVPLGSAVCLLFGCCSRRAVRQVAPHGPPDPALLGLLQDGVLKSQVSQPALLPCEMPGLPSALGDACE